MYAPATKKTRVELDAARVLFTGTQSVRISYIHVCNGAATAKEVVFRNAATTEVLSVSLLANTSHGVNVVWICDDGLNIDSASDAGVSVTVFHGAVGA